MSVDVNNIIEKLAEKIGCAVEKVEPLATKTVGQYIGREVFYAKMHVGYSLITLVACSALACFVLWVKIPFEWYSWAKYLVLVPIWLKLVDQVHSDYNHIVIHYAASKSPLCSMFKL